MTAIGIKMLPVADLVPFEANAKKHPQEQIDKLAMSIAKFGWTQPIVVDRDLVIIAGHGRRLAALQRGDVLVPVLVRDDLSKLEADALRLADNRVTSTDYDQAMIQEELRRLAAEMEGGAGFDLSDLGFDAKELSFTLSDLGDMNEDFFADDINEAVADQKKENEATISATDDVAAPVGDALGFKRVTIAQSREISALMGEVRHIFPELQGPEMLVRAFQVLLGKRPA